jgi:hypothetical protein
MFCRLWISKKNRVRLRVQIHICSDFEFENFHNYALGIIIIIIILFCSKNPYLELQPSDIEQVNNIVHESIIL